MDKENSGNLEDILEQLKSTVEGTDGAPEVSLKDDVSDSYEPMNAELLAEKLREQFMFDEDAAQKETEADEYTIDSDLISEFYEEESKADAPENDVQADVEAETEEKDVEAFEEIDVPTEDSATVLDKSDDYEPQEGEIVEIAIPFLENLESDSSEDFGGELNEDYFDEEAAENSYVCFADGEATDEEIFELPEEESLEEDTAEDDLPWYDDEDEIPRVSVEAEQRTEAEEIFEEEPTEEELNIILPISADEYDDEEDEIDRFMDDEEEELLSHVNDVIVKDEEAANINGLSISDEEEAYATEEAPAAEEYEAPEQKPYSLFEKAEPIEKIEADEAEEDSSFYRMMIDARAKREAEYGYFTDGAAADEALKSEDQASGEEMELGIEDIDIPEFNAPAYVSVDLSNPAGTAEADAAEELGVTDVQDEISTDENGSWGTPFFDYDHEETEAEAVEESEKNILWGRVKPILLSVITFAILILELLPVLNIIPDGIFDYTAYPWTYIFIDAQLLIFAVAICYKKLIDGFMKLFTSEANLYSVLSITVIVTLLGSILSCFSAGDVVPKLYNFIGAAYLLAVYFLEKMDAKRIENSISILSEESVFTLKRSQGKNSCAEKMYAGGLDPDTSILEPVEVETDDLDGVFAREKLWQSKSFTSNLVISSAIPITMFAVFMAMVSIVSSAGLAVTVNAFSFTFAMLAPLSATVAYYLPIFISYRRLLKRGCVIAGYDGAATVSDCDAVIFADGHLFKNCEASEAGIKLYCDDAKTRDLFVCLGAVYMKIGGPMQNTFSSVLGEEEHTVSMVRITRSGFEAVVDNRANIIVGSSDYLARYGIATDRADAKESGILYVALNSSLAAKISVTYKTQPLFEELNAILERHGVRSVVETYDPIISGKYVAKCRSSSSSPISVVHKNINDYKSDLEAKDRVALGRSGAFATSSRLKLVELLTFCKSITKLKKINTAFLIASYVAAALMCAVFAFGGKMEEVNLFGVLLYQMIFLALYAVSAARILPLSFDGVQKKKAREEMKN